MTLKPICTFFITQEMLPISSHFSLFTLQTEGLCQVQLVFRCCSVCPPCLGLCAIPPLPRWPTTTASLAYWGRRWCPHQLPLSSGLSSRASAAAGRPTPPAFPKYTNNQITYGKIHISWAASQPGGRKGLSCHLILTFFTGAHKIQLWHVKRELLLTALVSPTKDPLS